MILIAETPASQPAGSALCIELPAGLIGLRQLTRFEIAPVEGSWPFLTLRSVGDEQWNFLLLEPAGVLPNYSVELSDEDTDALELTRAEDAYVFNIVTIHSTAPQYATANLLGPIVVNRRTMIGRQVITANSDSHSAHYVLADDRHMERAA